MKVTVIVPTYNGAHKLPKLISALDSQSFKAFETIIVVDGSTDNTLEVLQNLPHSLCSLKIIQQVNKGRAAVRNKGVRMSEGDLLVFFDDDMIPVENCVQLHVQHHKQFQDSILVGASSEPVSEESSDFLHFKVFLNNKWMTPLQNKGTSIVEQPFLAAANCSISKELFYSLGGFDERLNDAEDFDLAVRSQNKNIPIYYSNLAFAWHNDLVTAKSYIRRLRQYREAHLKLANLKPEIKRMIKWEIQNPQGLKSLFFKIFCRRIWIESIDRELWSWLPKRLRYKIYDWVITANGSFFPKKVKL